MKVASDAARNIRDNLRVGWFDGVGAVELRENNAILDRLTPNQTNDVISALSDDELGHWVAEIHDGRLLDIFGAGGLTLDQRRDLLDNLCTDLDAGQLERVYRSLGTQSRQAELLDSVAARTNEPTRVAIVARLAGDTTDRPFDIRPGFGLSTTERWDQDAHAVSTLIGSLRQPVAIEASITSLSTPQLEAVLEAGTNHATLTLTHAGGVSHSHSFGTGGIIALIDAAGRSTDADLKARVFELASRQIDEIRSTDRPFSPSPNAEHHARSISDALFRLMNTNTGAIVTALERGDGISSSRTGNGMSSWVAELVRQGDTSGIQNMIAKLQAGDALDAEPAEYLSRFTVDEYGARDFQNASNLGFLVGAVREGINAIDADARQQADMLHGIFGIAASLGSLVIPGSGLAGRAAWIVGSSLTKELIGNVTDELSSGRSNLQDALEQLALPEAMVSSDVTGPYGSAINNVERH